jgi:hypothetical protein
MKYIVFDPSKLTGDQAEWWKAWQTRADEATVAAIDAWERGEEFKFKDVIWGDLKQWLLLNVFHGKCAYCETRAVRYPGHAEHFRPKGRVDVRDPKTGRSVPASVEWPDGTVATHPGYFWLAYHWKNLLPACQDCNSGRGKQNQFPLLAAHHPTLVAKLAAADAARLAARARASVKYKQRYYLDPDALDEIESPQILNPYVEDPRRHLRFGEGGIVAAVDGSEKGTESIRVYQLDDENLRGDRQKQQKAAELIFRAKLGANIAIGVAPNAALQAADDALAGFRSGDEPYSIAALDYMEIVRKQFEVAFQGGRG